MSQNMFSVTGVKQTFAGVILSVALPCFTSDCVAPSGKRSVGGDLGRVAKHIFSGCSKADVCQRDIECCSSLLYVDYVAPSGKRSCRERSPSGIMSTGVSFARMNPLFLNRVQISYTVFATSERSS